MPLLKNRDKSSAGKPPTGPVGKGKGKGDSGQKNPPILKQPKRPVRRGTSKLPEKMSQICNKTNIFTILFVFIVSVVFLAGGITLVVMAKERAIQDLYIAGGFCLFIAVVSVVVGVGHCCHPLMDSNRVAALLPKSDGDQPAPEAVDYLKGQNLVVNVQDAIKNRRPSVEELYGDRPTHPSPSRRVVISEPPPPALYGEPVAPSSQEPPRVPPPRAVLQQPVEERSEVTAQVAPSSFPAPRDLYGERGSPQIPPPLSVPMVYYEPPD